MRSSANLAKTKAHARRSVRKPARPVGWRQKYPQLTIKGVVRTNLSRKAPPSGAFSLPSVYRFLAAHQWTPAPSNIIRVAAQAARPGFESLWHHCG